VSDAPAAIEFLTVDVVLALGRIDKPAVAAEIERIAKAAPEPGGSRTGWQPIGAPDLTYEARL